MTTQLQPGCSPMPPSGGLRPTLFSGRSRWRWLLTTVWAVLMSAGIAQAQVSAYTFAQSTGNTYTPITGGTVAATATAGSQFSLDNTNFSATIPFGFVFNGTSYTSVSISSNGYVTFGSTTSSTTNYTPIAASTGFAGAIAVFARDLVGDATAGNLGEIRYETLGSTGSRTFVVQYKNFKRYISGTQADNLNFQIRLSEGTNAIVLAYGSNTASTTAGTVQVGLRGASNSDYNDRTSATSWTATTAGSSNAATVATSSTIIPPSGLNFTYTPPSCSAPGSVSSNTVTSNSANITFTAGNGNTSFTVTATPTTGSPVTATGSASPIALTGLAASTSYSVVVTGNCSGGATANSSAYSFSTPIVNDNPTGAISLTMGATCTPTNGTNAGATTTTPNGYVNGSSPDCAVAGSPKDVWY